MIAWTEISAHAHWTIQHIALPLSMGYSETEIAHTTGLTRRAINHQLDKLREELTT